MIIEGSITLWLVSSLAGLVSVALLPTRVQITTFFCLVDSKPFKLATSRTVLPLQNTWLTKSQNMRDTAALSLLYNRLDLN